MVELQGVLEQRYGAGKKPGLFFHDAWNEYAVVLPEKDEKFSLHSAVDYTITWGYQEQLWLQP
jgi:hypothetical protein